MSAESIAQPGAVSQVPSAAETLIVAADFPDCPPDALFAHWTTPELLRRWWPPEATIEPRVGGAYHLAWPQMDWHLRGHYTAFAPGRSLGFTWWWDHDRAGMPAREVAITFAPLPDGGTRLTVVHGPYSASEADQEDRRGHLEGWTAFLGELQEVAQ